MSLREPLQGATLARTTHQNQNYGEAFTLSDWALLVATALMWGGTFFLTDLALDGLHPLAIAWLRVAFGFVALSFFKKARQPLPRQEWPSIALLGLVWMVIPFLLFPIAQQWIASSLAGMINGASPLFTAAIAAIWYRRAPKGLQLAGLLAGFAGIVSIYLPSLGNAHATALGAGLVLLATASFGIAYNLAGPLQSRNGALPVIWRAQLFSLVVLAPFAIVGMPASTFTWANISASVLLGTFSTGFAFACFTIFVGRVGPSRGSVTIYFVPAIAIALGVVFRNETVAWTALGGMALVLVGAYLTSRREGPRRDAP